MFNVYVLQNPSNKVYIGYTGDLVKRLARYNGVLRSKNTSFTSKNKGPCKLVYKEKFLTRTEAVKREKELKSSRGRDYIRRIMANK